jgi:glutaredoxin
VGGLGISIAAMLIGGIMCIAAAFRHGILWGLAYLFVPFANLVFIIKYWSEAKKGFFISAAGCCVFLGLYFIYPHTRAMLVRHPEAAAASAPNKEKEFSAAIEEKRSHLLTLRDDLAKVTADSDVQYKELSARRNALDAKDQAAVHQFNVEASAYQKQVQHLKQLTQEIDAANAEVEDLLAKRTAEKKQVVIYSTSWCPACQQAKRYMDGKGIKYRDVDVEKSREGGDEYRRQGGDGGVPLIVVGEKKIKGFNASELDSML